MSEVGLDDDISAHQNESAEKEGKGVKGNTTTMIERELMERPRLIDSARSPVPGSVYALQLSLWNMKERCKKQELRISELQADNQQLQNNSIRLREKNLSLHQEIHQKHQEYCNSRDELLALKHQHVTATNELARQNIKQTELKKEVARLTEENVKLLGRLAYRTPTHRPHFDTIETDRAHNIWSKSEIIPSAKASEKNGSFAERLENLQRTTSEPALNNELHKTTGLCSALEKPTFQNKENKFDSEPFHSAVAVDADLIDNISVQEIQRHCERMKQIREILLSHQNTIADVVRKHSAGKVNEQQGFAKNVKTEGQACHTSGNSTSEQTMAQIEKNEMKNTSEEPDDDIHIIINAEMELDKLQNWGNTPLNSVERMLCSDSTQKDREISDVMESTAVIEKCSNGPQQKREHTGNSHCKNSVYGEQQDQNIVYQGRNEYISCDKVEKNKDTARRKTTSGNESQSHLQERMESSLVEGSHAVSDTNPGERSQYEQIDDQSLMSVATGNFPGSCDDDHICPMCQAVFPKTVPQEEFEAHVVEHFSYEEKEILQMNFEFVGND